MRQYMIRIRTRKWEKHQKVERDESVGNVPAVVRLLASTAGAVSAALKWPQSPYSPQDINSTTTVKLTAIWILLWWQRQSVFPVVGTMLLLLQSAIGGCFSLTKLTVMESLRERKSCAVLGWTKRCPLVILRRQLCRKTYPWMPWGGHS